MHASRTPRPGTARQAQPPFRVACRPLDWDLSAADALRLVRHDPHPVALLGAWADGSDIVASCPAATSDQPDTPFSTDLVGPTGEACFGGGWIGYLGFAAARGFLPIPPPPGEPRRLPACWFGYYDHVLRRDRATGRWFFEALITPGREQLLEQRLAELSRRAGTTGPGPHAYTSGTFRLIPSPGEHKAAVRETVCRIGGTIRDPRPRGAGQPADPAAGERGFRHQLRPRHHPGPLPGRRTCQRSRGLAARSTGCAPADRPSFRADYRPLFPSPRFLSGSRRSRGPLAPSPLAETIGATAGRSPCGRPH